MPIYKLDVQTRFYTNYFTNVYHINVPDLDAAETAMDNITSIHQPTVGPNYTIVAGRVSTPAAGDGVFITRPYTKVGTRSQAGQDMPLFNRFLVEFQVGNTYKCRKFIAGIQETDNIDGGIPSGSITYYMTNYALPIIALGVCCNEHGAVFTAASVKDSVAMRQLRRRKKRTTPVI